MRKICTLVLTDGNGSFSIRRFGWRRASRAVALLAFSVLAALAAPRLSLAQTITFPNPTVQVPWATGKTAFGHIKSKTGPLDVLGSGTGQFPTQAQVWLNDGHGNLTAGALLPVAQGNAEEWVLADLNNDGYDDAILVSRYGLTIYLNDGLGDGGFIPGPAYLYGSAGYFPSGQDFQSIRVAAAKTTRTGNVDVIVTGAGSYGVGHVRLFSGNGDGTLAPNPVDLATGFNYLSPEIKFVDVNNNGAPAIVVSAVGGNPVEVFGNDGSGTFSRTLTLSAIDQNESQAGVEFIDMDHDGVLDMVVLALDFVNNGVTNTVFWYKGLGSSTFDPTPRTAWSGGTNPGQNFNFQTYQWSPGGYFITSAADFDGDGQVDLAMSAQLTQPIILKNNGDGTFSPAWAAPLSDSNGLPAFALFMSYVDVTGTGQKSLIGSNYTNNSSQHYTPYGEFYGSPSTTPPDTTPPVITVPGNITAEATGSAGALVTFSASATDAVDGPVPVTCVPASGSTFPLGATSVNCSASDAHNNTARASFNVTVVDTTPPVITSATPSQASLWPPNHRMVSITVGVQASDLVDGAEPASACRIVSATSSEPDNGLGDGDQSGDIVLRGGLTVDLRAERSGTGTGRTYTLNVTCTDRAGNTSQPRATVVVVPHDLGNK